MQKVFQKLFVISIEYSMYVLCFIIFDDISDGSIENSFKAAAVLVGFTRVILPILTLKTK